ncbi:MAG: Asp23/Gls24 family envelope stress response protein [Lentisphaerae bacterium]|nr:Asp23/Gls24 family envelope stress response protein [Lentisphaerota bacterium]
MRSPDSSTKVKGNIQIHESVVTSIVRKVASETEGVSRISGSSIVDNIAEIVGSKRIQDRAISVQMGKSKVSVEVSVNLIFGYKLPDVASALQTAIEEEVKKLTGLNVSKVDIIIREIDDPVVEEE